MDRYEFYFILQILPPPSIIIHCCSATCLHCPPDYGLRRKCILFSYSKYWFFPTRDTFLKKISCTTAANRSFEFYILSLYNPMHLFTFECNINDYLLTTQKIFKQINCAKIFLLLNQFNNVIKIAHISINK